MASLYSFIRYALLLGSGVCLFISLSPDLQRSLDQRGLIPDQYRFGDLYNVSNLAEFKETDYVDNYRLLNSDKPTTRFSDVDLYLIGDSFIDIDTSFYAGNRNHYIRLGVNRETVTLDPTRKSILVAEVIERTIQERLQNDFRKIYFEAGYRVRGHEEQAAAIPTEPMQGAPSFWWSRFGNQINQRMEFLFFNFKPFLELKELKARIMLSCFDRLHEGALLSRDQDYIFYDVEADSSSSLSPFHKLSPADIAAVVSHIDLISEHYKRLGFDEVYFCLVPCKTTVCEPDRFAYNNQISRIEHHPKLKTQMISVRDTLMQHPEWYHEGDGHWDVRGMRLWLDKVNRLTAKWSGGSNAIIARRP